MKIRVKAEGESHCIVCMEPLSDDSEACRVETRGCDVCGIKCKLPKLPAGVEISSVEKFMCKECAHKSGIITPEEL